MASELQAMEARLIARFDAIDTRLDTMEKRLDSRISNVENSILRIESRVGGVEKQVEYLRERLERTETALLSGFHNWSRTVDLRLQAILNSTRA